MKLILAIVLSLAFMAVLRAQIIEVTAQGTVVNVEGSSEFGVQPGDTFTETFEINSATPGTSIEQGIENYLGTGADLVTAGSFSVSLPDAISSADIYSDSGGSTYGYQLRETYNTVVPVYADIYLLNYFTPAIAPTTSLDSIGEFPVTDFNLDAEIDYIDNVNDFGFAANISSYTVATIAAPEPSSWALGLVGIGGLLYMRRQLSERGNRRHCRGR
jgi:hypothetical protein